MKNVTTKRLERRPPDAWFTSKNLELCRKWLHMAENLERCGFGTPKLSYIAKRMRERIAELESPRTQVFGLFDPQCEMKRPLVLA